MKRDHLMVLKSYYLGDLLLRFICVLFYFVIIFLVSNSYAQNSPLGVDPKLVSRAQQGNVMAQFLIAEQYYHGREVPQSYPAAAEWYTKIAEGYERVRPYLDPEDLSQESCDIGESCALSIRAIKTLAGMYEQGLGVEKNKNKARALRKLILSNIESHDPSADVKTLDMAEEILATGPDTEQDKAKTKLWLKQAAESVLRYVGKQGMMPECVLEHYYEKMPGIKASFQLGLMYETGDGVEPDLMQAKKYYEINAMVDHADSLYRLGKMYEEGRGVEKSEYDAAFHYLRAAKQGHAEAISGFKRLLSAILPPISVCFPSKPDSRFMRNPIIF